MPANPEDAARKEPLPMCKECGKPGCYDHCPASDDGRHVIDPDSFSAFSVVGDCGDYVIEIYVKCGQCGYSGNTCIPFPEPDQLRWC